MNKIGLYLLGNKAYEVLTGLIAKFGSESISFVVLARDKNIHKDYYAEMEEECKLNGITKYERNEEILNQSDYSFAIGWRWIINDPNLIVFHDSILPRYRGFSPLVNMLINGEKKIGVTALKAVSDYDKGPIIAQDTIDIVYPIKIQQAIEVISRLYVKLAIDISCRILNNEDLPVKEQKDSDATYSVWRDEDDYKINWNQSSKKIQRFVNSVGYPYKGATTFINGIKYKVLEVTPYPDVQIESREDNIGKVIFMKNNCPVVICGEGLLLINSIYDDSISKFVKSIPFRSRFE